MIGNLRYSYRALADKLSIHHKCMWFLIKNSTISIYCMLKFTINLFFKFPHEVRNAIGACSKKEISNRSDFYVRPFTRSFWNWVDQLIEKLWYNFINIYFVYQWILLLFACYLTTVTSLTQACETHCSGQTVHKQ